MQEAWIDLQCPNCGENWQANPSDLPAPHDEYACQHCGDERATAEYAQRTRDLEVLESISEE